MTYIISCWCWKSSVIEVSSDRKLDKYNLQGFHRILTWWANKLIFYLSDDKNLFIGLQNRCTQMLIVNQIKESSNNLNYCKLRIILVHICSKKDCIVWAINLSFFFMHYNSLEYHCINIWCTKFKCLSLYSRVLTSIVF